MDKSSNSTGLRPQARPARRYPYIITAALCLAVGLYIFSSQATDHEFHAPRVSKQSYSCVPNEAVKRVAVIGAGSAGSSAAYYLHKYTRGCPSIQTTVFERASHIGGRSTTVDVYDSIDEPVELGASIFVQVNKNLVSAVEEFGLSTHGFRSGGEEELPKTLGVYDGSVWRYRQDDGDYGWWNIAKLLWKYGMAPIRTNRLMKATVGKFLEMYEEPHFPSRDLSETVGRVGLTSVTGVTGEQFLESNNLQSPFTTDIIQASTRVNYAQNLDQIHGLETMVCMATDGAMSVKGGNWQIFDGMLEASGANVMLNTSVNAFQKQSDGTFGVLYNTSAQPEDSAFSIFDTVIIAAPFQYTDIKFEPAILTPPEKIPYVNLHVTLFTSPHQLDGKRLGVGFVESIPTTILTTTNSNSNETLPYYSISTLRVLRNPKTGEKEYLYKIFSPEQLKPTFLNTLLAPPTHSPYPYDTYSPKDVTWIHEKVWQSYPLLPPRTTFEKIQLDDEGKIFYTGGIESFISTMETSSLMGMNVARLIVDGWMEEGRGKDGVGDGEGDGEGNEGAGGRGVNTEL